MRIGLIVEKSRLARWHLLLADHLRAELPGLEARFILESGGEPLPTSARLLLTLERMILRRWRPTVCDSVAASALGRLAGPEFAPDVFIDCTGRERRPVPSTAMTLRPLFDGEASEDAMIAALLVGRAPVISIEERRSGAILAAGIPSREAADGLTGAIEAVVSRLFFLVESALAPRRAPQAACSPQPRSYHAADAARFGARNLVRLCASRLYHLCCYAPHWRVGWRFVDGPGVLERGDLSGPGWNVLADPGRRCFADPFPITWQGRTFIFFEDLDHRVGRGFISAIEFDEAGPCGEPFPVIEEPWHLSYPFLIAHENELYMAPESSASGAIPLYRCVDFPHRWERCATLVDKIEAADPTIFRHAGRFWMMSCIRKGLGGYSDMLAIHHAADLLGVWESHDLNPALVDTRAARPAGTVVRQNDTLWRPVQDCSEGYGRTLGLARIKTLDPHFFAQEVVVSVRSGPRWPGGRLHTLTRFGRLECIDGTTYNPKSSLVRGFVQPLMRPDDGLLAGGRSSRTRKSARRA